MKTTYVFAAIAALAFTSCDYFLPGNHELISYKDYSSDYEGDRLVLSGYISDRYGVFAEVTHTIRPETPHASDTVSDAQVVLLRDNEPFATLHRNTTCGYGHDVCSPFAYYLTPGEVSIESGHTYSLRATSPTYGTAESDPDILPDAAKVDSVWAETYKYDGTYRSFNVAYTPAHASQTVYPMAIKYQNGYAIFRKFFNYYNRVKCISTSTTSAETPSLTLPHAIDSVSICVATFSDQTAQYMQSLADYSDSQDDAAYDYPLAVYNNVSGGYGFVGAFATSTMTIVADSVNQSYEYSDHETLDYCYDIYFDLW